MSQQQQHDPRPFWRIAREFMDKYCPDDQQPPPVAQQQYYRPYYQVAHEAIEEMGLFEEVNRLYNHYNREKPHDNVGPTPKS
jgi:hypothetical protein